MRPLTHLMAQYKRDTKTGELLTWNNALRRYLPAVEPYNLKLYGKSTQNGTPTPDAPIAIQSVSGLLRVTGADLTGGDTYGLPTLRGIPLGASIPSAIELSAALMAGVWHDGARYWCGDTYEPDVVVGGARHNRLIQRVSNLVLTGANVAWKHYNYQAAAGFLRLATVTLTTDCKYGLCNRLQWAADQPSGQQGEWMSTIRASTHLGLTLSTTRLNGYRDDWTNSQKVSAVNAYLAQEYENGNPYIAHYLLPEPVITLGDPVPVPSVRGTTNIYTTSAVQPHIRASVLTGR